MSDKAVFDAVRAILVARTGTGLTQPEVDKLNAALRTPDVVASTPAVADAGAVLTARVALEIVEHEAIVQEAYKDSVGVWTWGIGVTDTSGHGVMRYKDAPQTIEHCLRIYIWLLRKVYIPAVLDAFAGTKLTEAQFAAAVSFHYNTGAIGRASWVKLWRQGKVEEAKASFLEWRSPPEVLGRRKQERDLFFDGKWAGDGLVTVWPVKKPSYTPDWKGGKLVDIRADMEAALKGS